MKGEALSGTAANMAKSKAMAAQRPAGRKDKSDWVSDEQLATRIQAGDRLAAEDMVRRYQKKVFGVAYQMCDGNSDSAEDMVQEVFFRVFRSLDQYRHEAAFSTWLHRIAVNVCLDEKKRQRRWRKWFVPWPFGLRRENQSESEPDFDPPDVRPQADPLTVLRGRNFDKDVQKALETLSDRQRLIFSLKVFEDMPIAEISQVMEMAEGTVKSHLFRAARALRDRLKNWA